MANHKDLVPVSREEFSVEMVPCLSLVAPTGMDRAERQTWLNAAYKVLEGIPIALLKRGCAAAGLRADHPSKIVSIITKEIGEDWAWRRKASDPNWLRIETTAAETKVPCSPLEASEILRSAGLDMPGGIGSAYVGRDPDRPCRKPTREDYIRMGVSPDVLDGEQQAA